MADFIQVLLLGIGLSMDAFAVAICKGLTMKKIRWGQAVVIALFFGGFQALMPLLGWLLGASFKEYITAFDHYIAFGLLAFIGGKMIVDAVKPEKETEKTAAVTDEQLDLKQLFLMAVATSIDALAVGVMFALEDGRGLSIWASIAIIGCTTFAISILGVFTGSRFGSRFEKKAEIAGGIILVLIGLKILLEHLGVISF